MKQSELFSKTSKEAPKDETSKNAELLIRAGFIDKLMSGVYSFLPLGLRVLNKINNIVREEMNAIGGEEVLMPALQPKENWEKTNRYEVKEAYKPDDKTVLGWTHEEIVTPLVGRQIFSYKDLPRYVYQIQTKFRNEPRAKSGLLRGREFSMKDLYSFHTDQKDLDEYYEKVIAAYKKIFTRVGIGDITYVTFATGGQFSKYSHEFQTLAATGEDTIFVCEKCKVAVNKEIIEEQKDCPECGNKDLQEKKAIEVGNIFKLGDRFSKPFGVKFIDKDEKEKTVIMGCYGLGPTRVMGTLAEIYNDNQGLMWPKEIAPFAAHLISLGQNDEVEKIYKKLSNDENLLAKGIEVLYDDRDVTAGVKFADSDLMGIPLRIIVSAKTLKENSVEVKIRNEEKGKLVKMEKLASGVL